MAFFRRLLGVDRQFQESPSPGDAAADERVSANRYWRCPSCGAVQRKTGLDSSYKPGDSLPEGTEACARCGAREPAAAIYGGGLDFTGETEALTRGQAAQRYLDAEIAQDAAAIETLLARDAVHSSMRGEILGAKAIADRVRNSQGPRAGMLGRLQWSGPSESGARLRFEGKPSMPGMPFAGLTMTLSFDEANKITRVEMGRIDQGGTPA